MLQISIKSILLISSAIIAAPAFAQAPAATPTAASTEEIIVTGTRATNRTVASSNVPIDVISSTAITNQGFSETNKVLNQLVPSFNFPQPSVTDGTDVIRPATLRGLGPDQTLVLINGKRRHVSALLNINGSVGRGSAAVDMNLIPTLAIERIEVLRDGAASQYGSDAIAGVINVQLRKASDGGRVTASFGTYVTTLDRVANVTGLVTSAGQPVLDTADTRFFQGVSDGNRTARDGDTYTVAANIGLPVGSGFINVTAEYRDRDATNRAGFDLRPNYNRISTAAPFDARELTFNRLNFRYGEADTKDYNVFINAGLPLGEAFELYAFGNYGRRDGLSAGNYRQQLSANNRNFAVLTPNTAPSAANFVPLTADGFLPEIDTALRDYSVTAGIKGDLAGWRADLSVNRGVNTFDFGVANSLNTSFGTASQNRFDSGGLKFGQWLVNLDLSRDFDVSAFAGPVTLSFGGEYRNENFKIRPGELQSYAAGPLAQSPVTTTAANCVTLQGVFTAANGRCAFPGRVAIPGAQVFPGFPPSAQTNASRNSQAAYLEFDSNVTEKLNITAAGRFEHFSDFGNTVIGKLAARYEFVEGFALRGALSNGFRAPSLHQQYFTTTSTNFTNGVPLEVVTLANRSPAALALGSRPLRAEKSLNMSVGLTMKPLSNFTVTVDYYNIRVKDRIVLTENLGAAGTGSATVLAAVRNLLDTNGFQSIGSARFFINGLNTRTQGIDIIGNYVLNTDDIGKLTFSVGYNLNTTNILERKNELGPLAAVPGVVLFGRLEGLRITDGQPKNKLNLSTDWDFGRFGATLRTTRYGEVISPGNTVPVADPTSLVALGPDDLVLSPKWVTDMEVRFNVIENLQLAVGANNLFDVYPDRLPTGTRPTGGQYPVNFNYFPYSNFSPFGFNGRYLYARASFSW
jgi:iron complex outermembrane recepter protein